MDFGSVLGTIGGILGIIVLVILLGVQLFGEGATFRDRVLSSPTLSPLLILHYFLPYSLIILVIFMDIMSQLPQGIPSIVIAFILMILNRSLGAPEVPNDLCEIPGMKFLAANFVPQSLLFVSTVVFYLASFVTVSSSLSYGSQSANMTTVGNQLITPTGVSPISPSSTTRTGATWGLAISVVLIQLFGILTTPGCLTESIVIPYFEITLPAFTRAILAIVIGGSIGGGIGSWTPTLPSTQPSYNVSQQANQIIIPATINPNTPATQATRPGFIKERFQLGAGLGENPPPVTQQQSVDVASAGGSGAVSMANSSDQFVCEAYKNGQLVTSTLVE